MEAASSTPLVRPSRTWAEKPAERASSTVARTQWSVAIPHTSTASMPRSRSQVASIVGSVSPSLVSPSLARWPSKPL
ncbi:hypothetical protein BJF82_00420 [Kytococcus sp. CUA-901]|nr:hypothetical protein BJF82_00420 [Kytococcus sp. CUA-901]